MGVNCRGSHPKLTQQLIYWASLCQCTKPGCMKFMDGLWEAGKVQRWMEMRPENSCSVTEWEFSAGVSPSAQRNLESKQTLALASDEMVRRLFFSPQFLLNAQIHNRATVGGHHDRMSQILFDSLRNARFSHSACEASCFRFHPHSIA